MPSPARPPVTPAEVKPVIAVVHSGFSLSNDQLEELARQERETARRKQIGLPLAQDLYRTMLNTRISPAMRLLGFKGSGGRYDAPSSTRWSIVDLQRSAYSDAFKIQFTANLRSAERANFQKRPTGGGYGERIGFLTPHKRDYWWTLSVESDLDEVADDFISAVSDFGMKWMLAQP